MRLLDASVRQAVGTTELSQREAHAWVEFSAVQKAEAELRRKEYGSRTHLLLAFAALTEPLRGGDLGRVVIVQSKDAVPDTGNDLVVPAGQGRVELMVRDHKTATSMGTLQRVLAPALSAAVRQSLLQRPRIWLFEAPRGGAFREESQFIDMIFAAAANMAPAPLSFCKRDAVDRGRGAVAWLQNKVASGSCYAGCSMQLSTVYISCLY